LLGHVLGVVRTAKDAEAGTVDGDLFAFHQQAEGVMVAVQHGSDETVVVHRPIVPCGCAHRRQSWLPDPESSPPPGPEWSSCPSSALPGPELSSCSPPPPG